MTAPQISALKPATRRLHFIGIGGSGMAPLAELAFRSGFQVSGSDLSHSDTTRILQKLGIFIAIGNDSKNLHPEEHPTVIYSSAIKEHNPELMEANARKLPLMHRSDLLNYFISTKHKSITIAGTNGKSTTSAMIAYLLFQLGKDPISLVGANSRDFESLALCGEGDFAVAEADESDGTFLKYRPYVGVLTSIDLDHMDFYSDRDHLFRTFKQYLANIDEDGSAVINIGDANCSLMNQDLVHKKITYGFDTKADVQGLNYICKNGESYFSVEISGKTYSAHIKNIGKHNAENALACFATAHALGLDIDDSIGALQGFSGVKRRLELVLKTPNLMIYDDYAHNPSKIKSVLSALRVSCPESNIVVIFQPHRYSRIKTLYNNFVGSFLSANSVIVLPTYSSGEQDDNPILSETLVSDIEKVSKVPCFYAPTFDSAQEKATQAITENSIIITLGAGDVWHLAFRLKERLG